MKICRCCKVEKEFDAFHKNSDYKCGYNATCKECTRARQRSAYISSKRETPLPSFNQVPTVSTVEQCDPIEGEFKCICGKCHHYVKHGVSLFHYPNTWSSRFAIL